MDREAREELHLKIDAGVKAGVALAIEEHRRMGRSIVVWQDGKMVTIPPEDIPVMTSSQPAAKSL